MTTHASWIALFQQAAAPLLHASASYIRDCKRKDHSESDLLTQKYPAGVKRQRLNPDVVGKVFSFIVSSCPTPSGSSSLNFKQYVKDDDLYAAYKETCRGQHKKDKAHAEIVFSALQ